MAKNRITLRPRFARRLPDPFSNSTHGTERHIFFVSVADLPAGIALDPSPRALKTRWDIYKEVQNSLLDIDCTPGTFHLKNRGITIIARHVDKLEENEYQIEFDTGHGVIDGAHTYRLITEAQQDPNVVLPKRQFVKVEVITKVPNEWIGEISGALNTSIQAQRSSLAHLQEALQWIKDELQSEPYFKSIAWSESERGVYDVRDILCMLSCFNVDLYPNAGTHHPVVAYENKAVVVSTFEEEFRANGGRAFRKLRPLLKNILTLHDTIQLEFPVFHKRHGAKAGSLIETSSKKPFEFPFVQARSTERLARGALYPVLGAFRWFIDEDKNAGTLSWRGGFDEILGRWRSAAARLVGQSVDRVREVGGSPDAVGKSPSHWGMLHKEVAFIELTAPEAPPEPAPDFEYETEYAGEPEAEAVEDDAADADASAAPEEPEEGEQAHERRRRPAPTEPEFVEIPLTGIHKRLDPLPDPEPTGEAPVLLDPDALVNRKG